MYKCATCGFSSPEGGEHCGAPMAKESMYKCKSCDREAAEGGECCGGSMEKVCACGSGKYAADCCEAPQYHS